MDNAIDEVFKGGGLVGGLMGSLAKGVVGAAGIDATPCSRRRRATWTPCCGPSKTGSETG